MYERTVIHGDNLISVDDQQRQQRQLFAATDGQRNVLLHDLGKPENPEVHDSSVGAGDDRH
jgi:hypothetical protein